MSFAAADVMIAVVFLPNDHRLHVTRGNSLSWRFSLCLSRLLTCTLCLATNRYLYKELETLAVVKLVNVFNGWLLFNLIIAKKKKPMYFINYVIICGWNEFYNAKMLGHFCLPVKRSKSSTFTKVSSLILRKIACLKPICFLIRNCRNDCPKIIALISTTWKV